MRNFLKSLISRLAPSVFKPIPEGLLYILLQAVSREISGECPWDSGEGCQKGYNNYWYLKCRNILCPGYRHPLGLIAYTSESSNLSSIDNRFNYSSFRYLTSDDYIPIGTLGAKAKFDFGGWSDSGGYGAYYYGARYYGDNSINISVSDIQIGDKWTIECSALVQTVGPVISNPSNKGSYGPIDTIGPYRGNHDTIYTIEIIDFWGYKQNFDNAILQICLATCDGEWIDFWGEYFGISRLLLVNGYESDEVYKARIMKEITRAKGTRIVLLEEAKKYFNSDLVTITEYHQNNRASVVIGTDGKYYICIQNHTATDNNRPTTGANWTLYWKLGGLGGNIWKIGTNYIINVPPYFDGPVSTDEPAKGLMPYQFYINPPIQKAPSAKFVKTGSNLIANGTGYFYPYES